MFLQLFLFSIPSLFVKMKYVKCVFNESTEGFPIAIMIKMIMQITILVLASTVKHFLNYMNSAKYNINSKSHYDNETEQRIQ